MPQSVSTDSADLLGANYFFRSGNGLWINNGFNQVRFVVNGELVKIPEPSILALFGLGLAGLGFARRNKA